ncbi:MAG: dipeptide/oligopeptide/nickel ABC transporter ATP-binding protein [Thermofilum sp. ex4484_15]|nr:MAG: dipeptide/oligopeptide/nickel ABC transporter ATP-binding protein [Thermofilum sp. ex4484_15]
MNEEILRIEGLKVYFYTYAGVVKAIEGVNLSVRKGECFGLVGETGCGKSVTMRSVIKLVPPPGRIVSGKIYFEGLDVLSLPESEVRKLRGRKIGFIVQEPMSALDPLYKVGYQAGEPLLVHGLVKDVKEMWKRVVNLFKTVMIPEPKERSRNYPHELSGGMKQRVVIATAISCVPDLIIADEPTTNVDVTIQAQILDLLRDLRRKYGTTLILVTHNLGIVAEMCDRVAVMYAGQIVELANVYDLFKDPLHPYTKGLLEAVPIITKSREVRLKPIPGTIPNLIRPPPGCRFHPRCSLVAEICKRERPPMVEVKPEHYVACWLYAKR